MPEETPIGETLVEATPAAQAPVEELEIEAEEDVVEEAEEDEPPSNNLPGTITIETLGSIGIQGTTLFVIDRSSNGVAIVVLAQDGAAAIAAIDRLQTNDLSNCIQVEMVTICSTGESQDRLEAEIDDESPPDDEEEPSNGSSGGRVFILSDDGKAEGTRTSAAEFQAILSESYDVVVWSMAQDGAPTEDDLAGYDVYIIDSGDYAFDIDNADALSTLDYIESGGVMFAGAQSVPFLGTEQEPINDLQVADASHPLADGFTQDEVLALFESESDVLSVVVGDDLGDEAQAVFARGPDSPESGTAALVAVIDEGEAVSRIIITTFAFHRLPEDVQRTLALNAVEWLMIAGD